MSKWFNEDCGGIYPAQFQKINDDAYIQRMNIQEVKDEDGNLIYYTCTSRKITVDEYQEIMERREEIKQVVLETTNTAAYEDGYQAAMILLGGEE